MVARRRETAIAERGRWTRRAAVRRGSNEMPPGRYHGRGALIVTPVGVGVGREGFSESLLLLRPRCGEAIEAPVE